MVRFLPMFLLLMACETGDNLGGGTCGLNPCVPSARCACPGDPLAYDCFLSLACMAPGTLSYGLPAPCAVDGLSMMADLAWLPPLETNMVPRGMRCLDDSGLSGAFLASVQTVGQDAASSWEEIAGAGLGEGGYNELLAAHLITEMAIWLSPLAGDASPRPSVVLDPGCLFLDSSLDGESNITVCHQGQDTLDATALNSLVARAWLRSIADGEIDQMVEEGLEAFVAAAFLDGPQMGIIEPVSLLSWSLDDPLMMDEVLEEGEAACEDQEALGALEGPALDRLDSLCASGSGRPDPARAGRVLAAALWDLRARAGEAQALEMVISSLADASSLEGLVARLKAEAAERGQEQALEAALDNHGI